jgi:HSP20 family protein
MEDQTMLKEKDKKEEIADVTPWRVPFGLGRLYREFDRNLHQLWRRPMSSFGWPEMFRVREGEFEFQIPAIEIFDEKDDLVVKVELPGMKKEDLEINLSGDVLTIRGEKKKEKEVKEKGYYYSERSYGTFQRSIDIPEKVLSDKVSASFKDGVLEVRLQKSEEAKRKEINIKID